MGKVLDRPAIPSEFIVRLEKAGGKEFIKAEGLIYLGHLQGLKRIDITVMQFPTPESPGVCYAKAVVETDQGIFTDYGEVTPASKGQVGGQYPVSLACTRARNRALRQATNCPLTSYEEMGTMPDADADDAGQSSPSQGNKQGPSQPDPPPRPQQQAQAPAPAKASAQADGDPLQKLYDRMLTAAGAIHNEFGRTENVPEGLDLAGAEKRLDELNALYRTLRDGKGQQQGTPAGATPPQIDRLLKLQTAVGRPAQVPPDLSSEDAAAQIRELVAIFNEQSRGKRPVAAGGK